MVVVVALGGLGWFRFQAKRAAQPDVPITELARRDGYLYRAGQTAPFSGSMVEFHGDGSLRSRSQVLQGVLHGLSEGWHTNGQMEVRENFRDGVSHGLRTRWYATGTNASRVMIVEGRLQGTFHRWHENGVLAEEVELRGGTPHGLSRAYYPSGCLKAEARVEAGKVIEQKIWKDGESQPPPTVALGTH
jgi:antitoxin component YwqK of YwqJK toxin-antitoxin module